MSREALLKEIATIAFMVVMAVTNPTMADFKEYMTERVSLSGRSSNDSGLLDLAAAVGINAPRLIADQITADTYRVNYVVASTYHGKAGNWLGILGYFLKFR